MPEILKIDIAEHDDSLYVFDKTGKYAKKTNEGGWGHPNFKVSDISKAEFHITPPEGTEPIVIDVYPSLPNDKGHGFEILASDLGMTKITSGVWRFEYKVYHAPDTDVQEVLYVTCYKLLCGNVSCCIENKKANISVADVHSEETKKVLEMEQVLKNARYMAGTGDIKGAQKAIKYLNLQCECCS